MQEGSTQKVEVGTGNLGRLERCCLSCMGYIDKAQLQWEPAMDAKGNEEAPRSTLAAEGRLRDRWPCSSLWLDLVMTDPE